MKKILTVAATCLVAVSVMAVPAKRIKKTITLADGTTREVVLRGDEHVHFYQAEDGTAYQLDEQKIFRQVDTDRLSALWKRKVDESNEVRQARAVRRRVEWGAQQNPISGQKRGLVILVNFADKKMSSTHDKAFYERYFNGESFTEEGMYGSVHQYFYDCSYGQFDLEFDIIGPVTVSKNMAYYGENDADGNDLYAATMVAEACKLAHAKGVDWKKYDWDDDGFVDQVFVIYAGNGEAQGAAENTIWPHEYELSSAKYYGDGPGVLYLGGVRIDTYACSCELEGAHGTSVDGIGTACHEFSHCLGIPDFYDTRGTYNPNFGMDIWDVMDYGSYNGTTKSGGRPTGFTSYERWYCGWLTPTELTSYTEVEALRPLDEYPEAYIIRNQASSNEYYLLENRQKKGWFGATNAHGMLVLHVDFDPNAWAENTVNNTSSRQRMTIIPADNRLTDTSLPGDPFPGSAQKHQLTDTSTPKAVTYRTNTHGAKTMNFPITEITESGGVISFVAGAVELSTPKVYAPDGVTSNSFVAHWSTVKNAQSYEVELICHGASEGEADKTVTVETEETSHEFKDLDPTYLYSYRVRAQCDSQYSDWSGVMDVLLFTGGDAVADVESASQPSVIYDLQGRRVARTHRGLYIVGGKKYLAK